MTIEQRGHANFLEAPYEDFSWNCSDHIEILQSLFKVVDSFRVCFDINAELIYITDSRQSFVRSIVKRQAKLFGKQTRRVGIT